MYRVRGMEGSIQESRNDMVGSGLQVFSNPIYLPQLETNGGEILHSALIGFDLKFKTPGAATVQKFNRCDFARQHIGGTLSVRRRKSSRYCQRSARHT